MKILFPEFEIEDLLAKIKELKVDIVAEALIDKNGEKKTCLNFPDLSIIQCSSKELDTFFNYQESLYVLLLHEILGLIRIEETSSSEPNFLNSYLISKRIAKYVTRAGAYDFVLDRSSVNGFEFSMEQRVFKYSKERNTLGLNLRILYPTEKELIKGALKYVREECEMERKKITYMDGHAFDVKRGPDDCELKRHCISTSGTIFVRYICE